VVVGLAARRCRASLRRERPRHRGGGHERPNVSRERPRRHRDHRPDTARAP